jgi:hypothetical protein
MHGVSGQERRRDQIRCGGNEEEAKEVNFMVGTNRSRTAVVVFHRGQKKRYDLTLFDASDIANDNGESYELSFADEQAGLAEQDVVALRRDIAGVLSAVGFTA